MEDDSNGIIMKDDVGVFNKGFVEDDNANKTFCDVRRCHSDTSINEHTDEFFVDEKPKDLISNYRGGNGEFSTRTRHLSQPGPPRGIEKAIRFKQTPRPLRAPLVNVDGFVYDPVNRRFLKRPVSEGNFDQRNTTNESFDGKIRNPQIARLQVFAGSSDVMSNKLVQKNSLDTRSMGGGSMHRSIAPSYKSIGSSDHHSVPPSTPQEKSRAFRSMISSVASCMYAVLIVTIGLILFIFDIFTPSYVAEVYCLYLVIIGFLYLGYLLIDLRIYTHKAKQHYKMKRQHEEACDAMLKMTEVETLDGPVTFVPTADSNGNQDFTIELPPPAPPLEHPYCFTQGRHAGSFYLKIGAAGFCLGHLVHSALLLSLQIMFINSDSDECGSIVVLILEIIYPIYSFFQLYFIFKYSNVIILRNKGPGRLALMHFIASSLCFWIWTIIRETMDAIVIGSNKKGDGDYDDIDDNILSLSKIEPNGFYARFMPGLEEMRETFDLPSAVRNNCSEFVGFDTIFHSLSPYLYPFTVEYSILIVGIFFIIWANIGNCPKEDADRGDYHDKLEWVSDEAPASEVECKVPTATDHNGNTSNLVIHIDCHAANKGAFGGMLVLVFTIVAIIMCFILFSDRYVGGTILLRSSNLVLHIIMLIAVGFAYNQIKKLDVNPHPVSLLDDILLFICIPAFVMDLTFTVIATIEYTDVLLLVMTIMMTLQALIQIPFIADGLRRCSNTKQLQRRKPGRELVTFLIVCNVATWIFETFSVKNGEISDMRYDFYGKILWSILGHVTTPLIMFYRFHSSVCLVDIWKGAYEPGNAH